jgi:hypothetical protein
MAFQKYLVHTISFFACLLIFCHGPAPAAADRNKIPEISCDKLKQMIGQPKTIILDVRRSRSWWRSSKKIVTAVREDPSKIDKWVQKYARELTLIFYCS